MNVYQVGADLACGLLTHAGDEDDYVGREQYWEAAGKPSTTGWQPPHLDSPRGKGKLLPVDCVAAIAFGAQDMLLNHRAREALASLLLPCGEYLPVELDGLDYHWFNCTASADIADQDRIEGERSAEPCLPSGWWDHITRWSFHPERLADAPVMFTTPQRPFCLMCTDVLREAVEAHDLLGFQFDLLWSPEGGGVEIDNSLGQFFGESGRQMNIAGRARRVAMQKRLGLRPTRYRPRSRRPPEGSGPP